MPNSRASASAIALPNTGPGRWPNTSKTSAGIFAKGNTPEHVAKSCSRVLAVLDGCVFELTEDLAAAPVMEFVGGLRDQAPARVELDARTEWFTRAELAAVLGINRNSVARLLRRDGLQGDGKGKARRYSRATIETLQDRLCRGRGAATCNHYLVSVKGFTRWLARENRTPPIRFPICPGSMPTSMYAASAGRFEKTPSRGSWKRPPRANRSGSSPVPIAW